MINMIHFRQSPITLVIFQVKQVAELTVGCLTQCIKGKTMFKMNPATVGNILLKVNAKLNGLNHQIATMSRPACLNVPCMIMGKCNYIKYIV